MFSKASHPARHIFLMSAAIALLLGGLVRTAAAKECTTDLDCDTGYQCVLGYAVTGTGTGTAGATGTTPGTAGSAPLGGATSTGAGAASGSAGDGAGGAGGSIANPCPAGTTCATTATPPSTRPLPAKDAGAAPPADAKPLPPTPVPMPEPMPMPTTGICEPKPIVCTSVADCPSADFDCVMDSIPSTQPTCAPNMKCETPPPQTSTTGTCNPKVRACSTATDCPAPLTCQAEPGICTGGGSVGPDGTVTKIPDTCTPGPSVCTWSPVTCAIDADCANPLYQCVKTGDSGGGCSSSGGGTCAAGETCPPVPQQSTCDTTAIMYCLPKLVDCACGPCPAGATCGPCATCLPGWSCFDFASVGGVPTAWGSIASNMACLPDGIVMAAQGHAAVNGDFGGSSSSAGSAPTRSAGDAGLATNTGPSPVNPVPPRPNEGAGSAAKDTVTHSSGCAYGGSDASSLALALAMTGLVVRLARRRNRAR